MVRWPSLFPEDPRRESGRPREDQRQRVSLWRLLLPSAATADQQKSLHSTRPSRWLATLTHWFWTTQYQSVVDTVVV